MEDVAAAAPVRPEYTSISGAWVLDLDGSDTFEDYLRCLGAPEGAVRAQVAGEHAYLSRNVIALDESMLVIHKDTAVNNFTERFKLDREQISRCGFDGGVRRTSASLGVGGRLDGYVIATTTSAPPPSNRESETIEARQLLDGGHGHIQQINVRNLLTGVECKVVRNWVRVPLTPADQMRLLG
eukprot:g10144.t1